jgi:hypothetical protein
MNMNKGIIAIISLVAAVALCGVMSAVTAYNDGGNSNNPNLKNETFGNCLSLPVIWADGVTKDLRGDPGNTTFDDEWWYVWVINATTGETLSCAPNSTDMANCSNGDVPGNESEIVYLQQRENNTWQAESLNVTAENSGVHVDLINWGDNLEAVSWNENSVVRTEVVLFQNLSNGTAFPTMQGFNMLHVDGLGINEIWGTNTTDYQSSIATVYSGCARWTIQKLDDSEYINNTGDIEGNLSLTWNATTGEWDGNVSETYFNGTVWDAVDVDGPGYYSAEINVGGKVIYGYNWYVKETGDGPGFYRLTFSLDSVNCPVTLNTFFTNGTTSIVEFGVVEGDTDTSDPSENDPNGNGTGVGNNNSEANEPNDGEDSNNPGNLIPGGIARIDFVNNLTYMDVQILEK